MARRSVQQSTRGRASHLPVLRWLQVGAVSAGLGVAVIAAPPLAAAQDSPASTTATETTTDSTTPTTDTETTTDTDESASAQDSTDTSDDSDISDELTDQTDDTPTEAEPTPTNTADTDTEAPAEDPDTGESATGSVSTPRADNDPAAPPTVSGDPSPAADHSESTQPDAEVSPSPPDSLDANTADTNTADTGATDSGPAAVSTPAVVVTPVRAAAAAVSPPSYPAPVLAPVTWRSVAIDMLSWTLGVTDPALPFIPNSPAPDWLAGLWREIRKLHYTLFNTAPTLNPTEPVEDPYTTLSFTGSLGGFDADGDVLTYTVIDPPAQGSVDIAADGTWTYTVAEDFIYTPGLHSFTVAVSDTNNANPRHNHRPLDALIAGFARLGLLPNPQTRTISFQYSPAQGGCSAPQNAAAACGSGGNDVSQAPLVTVNRAPTLQVKWNYFNDDDAGFYYTFTPTVSDPDGDPVTITVDGALSTIKNSNGTYTAEIAPTNNQSDVVVRASDGRGGVTVAISTEENVKVSGPAPILDVTGTSFDPSTGNLTLTVTRTGGGSGSTVYFAGKPLAQSDANTYTHTYKPTKGATTTLVFSSDFGDGTGVVATKMTVNVADIDRNLVPYITITPQNPTWRSPTLNLSVGPADPITRAVVITANAHDVNGNSDKVDIIPYIGGQEGTLSGDDYVVGSGTWIWTPNPGFDSGTDIVGFRARDEGAGVFRDLETRGTILFTPDGFGTVDVVSPADLNLTHTRDDNQLMFTVNLATHDTLEIVPQEQLINGQLIRSNQSWKYVPELTGDSGSSYTDRVVFRAESPTTGGFEAQAYIVQDFRYTYTKTPTMTPSVGWPRTDGKNDIELNLADPDGNQVSVAVTKQPDHGTLVPFAKDKFVYIPDPTYTGIDLSSAEFTATDSNGATTTITIPEVAGAGWVQQLLRAQPPISGVNIDVNPNFSYEDAALASMFSDLAYNHRDADFATQVQATGWKGIGVSKPNMGVGGFSPAAGGYGVKTLQTQSYAFAGQRTAADGTVQFVVAFEGSNSPGSEPADWVANALQYGWSHYYASLMPLMNTVVGQMLQAQDQQKKTQLILTGHSLGGALSMMAFADLLAPKGNLWPGTSDVLKAGHRVLDSVGGWSLETRTALLTDTTVYTFGAPSILIEPVKLGANTPKAPVPDTTLLRWTPFGPLFEKAVDVVATALGTLIVDESKLPKFKGVPGISFDTRVFQFEHANTSPAYPGDSVAQIGSRDPGDVLEINLHDVVHILYAGSNALVPAGTHPMGAYQESVIRLVGNRMLLKSPNDLAQNTPKLTQTSSGKGSDIRNDFFINASDDGKNGNDLFVYSKPGTYTANGGGGTDTYSIGVFGVTLAIDGARQSGRDSLVFDLPGTPVAQFTDDVAVFSVKAANGESSSVTITNWDQWQVSDVFQVITTSGDRLSLLNRLPTKQNVASPLT
ncbi:MAG: Ig-like domain-containing protein [Mycolicibacterium sp.]|uniref:Ig-like domain-containing protein n=1 Tax=Mycolicibacterium sp. TaxID=2320850 RepID=UPI003D0DCEBE